MINVRKSAYNVLFRVLKENAYSALTINSEINNSNLDTRDASFLSALVYGVLERKLYLDYIISQYSSLKLNKVDFGTLIVLELGIYQILFMDKVPDNAAVDESVKLAKKVKLFRSTGYINALLRSFIRNGKNYKEPKELYIKYSVDKSIVDILVNSYGEEETIRMLSSLNGRPPIFIRVNTIKTSIDELIDILIDEKIDVKKNDILPNCLEISETGSLEKLESFKKGLFYVQDFSSQLCSYVLNCKENDVLCDVCSAPGGKSLYSAISMNNKGLIYSYDLHNNKLKLISESANRLGVSIIKTSERDATKPNDNNIGFDKCNKILCDVPCSGIGIMRRKPEIRYKKDTIIDLFPKLQYDILCINGDLGPINCDYVYSTCSINPKENIQVVNNFLKNHKEFITVPIELPYGLIRQVDEPDYMFTMLPGNYNADGFFIAKLRKVKSNE